MPCPCCGEPGPCCKKIPGSDACGPYFSCEDVSLRECCESRLSAGSCGGTLAGSGLATPCTPNGNKPSNSAPFYCANGTYKNGAYVTIEGWYPYPVNPSPPWAAAMSLMNNTFYIPAGTCGPSPKNFDFTIPRATTGCNTDLWRVSVFDLSLCPRTVGVEVFTVPNSCFSNQGIDFDTLSEETVYLDTPCSQYICNCVAFGGASTNGIFPGIGTVNVTPA